MAQNPQDTVCMQEGIPSGSVYPKLNILTEHIFEVTAEDDGNYKHVIGYKTKSIIPSGVCQKTIQIFCL